MADNTPTDNLERLFAPRDAADFLDLSTGTLKAYRAEGRGPRYFRFSGKYVKYRLADLIAWRDRQAVETRDSAKADAELATC